MSSQQRVLLSSAQEQRSRALPALRMRALLLQEQRWPEKQQALRELQQPA
jgi:hypothetical protein